MAHGHYEDPAKTLGRNEARLARQEKARREDRAAEVADWRSSRRSI